MLQIGTDIEDTKCSWLIVQALKRANDSQKQILKVGFDLSSVSDMLMPGNELKMLSSLARSWSGLPRTCKVPFNKGNEVIGTYELLFEGFLLVLSNLNSSIWMHVRWEVDLLGIEWRTHNYDLNNLLQSVLSRGNHVWPAVFPVFTFQDNYGKKDPSCVAVVKRVFNELELQVS